MNLQHRLDLMNRLGEYILSNDPAWEQTKRKEEQENGWFIPEFIDLSVKNIARFYLQKDLLENWVTQYPTSNLQPRTIGIVMAGNIPLVGFHDMLAVFMSGHKALIKPSSKDQALIRHLVAKIISWDNKTEEFLQFSEMLRNCDAYIATGSNNSSRYFDYYFGKYPHIIRRNKTSVAILTGNETVTDLEKLSDDVYTYFGLGCRNVTKIYVPEGYDFVPLLEAFRKYNYLADHHKYKNNYDYNLTLLLMNKKFYMTNGSILLSEDTGLFSPISQLNYEFYSDRNKIDDSLMNHPDLQCVVGKGHIPFRQSQSPSLNDYADGVDTMEFLTSGLSSSH